MSLIDCARVLNFHHCFFLLKKNFAVSSICFPLIQTPMAGQATVTNSQNEAIKYAMFGLLDTAYFTYNDRFNSKGAQFFGSGQIFPFHF